MALFSALTGSASAKAAKNNATAINNGLNLSYTALGEGYDAAGKLLGTGNGGSALSSLGAGYDTARNDVMNGGAATQGYLGQIGGLFDGLTQSGQQATDARSDALGLNGAEGNARASAAFKGSLGYGAGLDEGLDGVMRSASARGMLAGGNTSRDLFEYGADYQNRQAGSYVDRLSQAGQNLATGVAGQASGLGLQGAAAQSTGSTLGSLAQSFGQNEANIFGTASGQQAQYGQGKAGLQTGAANAYVQNNSALAASQNQASSNLLGGILGLGQLAASPVGANGATGTAGGSFFNYLSGLFK